MALAAFVRISLESDRRFNPIRPVFHLPTGTESRLAMRVDERHHHGPRRSSSAGSKYADALRKISFAQRGSLFSRSNALRRAWSSVVRSCRAPALIPRYCTEAPSMRWRLRTPVDRRIFMQRLPLSFLLALACTAAGVLPSSALGSQTGRVTLSSRHVRCGDLGRSHLLVRMLRAHLAQISPTPQARDWWSLAALPPDSVILVTNDSVCDRAARTYYGHTDMVLPKEIAVARVGDRYAVYGSLSGGEWGVMELFTLGWWRTAGVLV